MSTHKILLLILTFTYSLTVEGQKIDSLKQVLSENISDKNKASVLKDLMREYYFKDLDSSLVYADSLINFAIQNMLPIEQAKGLYHQAKVYNAKGNYEKGIHLLSECREIYQDLNNPKGIAQCLNVFGNIYQSKGEYELANQYYDSTIVIASGTKDSLLIAYSYQGLGMSCDYRGQFDKAIDYYFKGIKIFEAMGDKTSLSKAYSNIGIIFLNTKEFDKAVEYFNKSIELKKEQGNYKGLAITFDNLAALYVEAKNFDKAQEAVDSALVYANKIKADKQVSLLFFRKGSILQGKEFNQQALSEYKKGLQLAKKLSDDFYTAVGQINIGQLLCSINQIEEGKTYLNMALSYAEKTGFLQMEQAVLNSYVETYKGKTSFEDLTNKYSRLIAVNDSLYAKEKFNSLSEIETKYQTEKKETQNQLLKKDKELQATTIQQQRTTLLVTIGGIGLFALMSFLLYRQSTERKRANTTLAEQRNQIETLHQELAHRVKNNLFFISTLMKMQEKRVESKEAKQAIREGEARLEAMSLLHRKLHLGENENDIDIGGYLQELCANLQNTFPYSGKQPQISVSTDKVLIDGDPAVKIGLIVNELVTNSFKYAFKEQKHPQINIAVRKTGDDAYQLTYQDNGIGIPVNLDISKSESMGLKLIHSLTKQLDGTIEISNQKGAHFQFEFKQNKLAI